MLLFLEQSKLGNPCPGQPNMAAACLLVSFVIEGIRTVCLADTSYGRHWVDKYCCKSILCMMGGCSPQTKYSIFYYITPFIDVIPRGKKFFPCGSLVNITVLPDLDLHMLDQTVTPSVGGEQSVDKKFAGCKFELTLQLIVS